MSEIEKMYENAGCKKILCDCTNCKKTDCTGNVDQDTCANLTYSSFTAEKQLKLIEFMLKKYGEETIGFELWKDNSYHAMCQLGYDGFENYADSNTLCGAIAGLITLYWQDLTEEEKQQVKGIFE